MIEEHSLFDRFAANSVRCLNEVSSQGELADKRPVKKASMDFVFRTYNIWICFNLYGNVRGLQIKVFSVGGGVYVVLC